ncbi:deoxyribodipyrimidine photo-lyase [Saliphagus sp. LR7]|uniref:cryptochrome/photolyase family protein n=1 Tax=Saliphagus sp. LR7 TaxID=2282654 RepID=UPI000DF7923E|nr:deoxyribodipyrimidine photo-lyase [Saliphagus sp. LR7]
MRIHWHRRDLRIADNRGLAGEDAEEVLSVFVFDPAVLGQASPIRVACLLEAVTDLRERYRERGADLLVERGDPTGIVPRLADSRDADRVSWNADYSGLARERDRAAIAAIEDRGLEWKSAEDALLFAPGSISPNEGDHYSVFSYFWEKWADREKDEPVDAPLEDDLLEPEDPGEIPGLDELGFDEPEADPPAMGRELARDRLETFCEEDIYRYAEKRDYPAAEATSRLSVDLKWGVLGIREIYAATGEAMARVGGEGERDSVAEFRRQLAWREFYAHVLAHNPEMVGENLSGPDRVEWRSDPGEIDAWKTGKTGYPIVDAGMRQLLAEGYVHNRVRMIVASFLTKDLLADWRVGYDWYREHLADHDAANDAGGWQWAASTGADAQPYFRVFNPTKQGREYDPDAEYIREFVPELADCEPGTVHDWPDLSDAEREERAPDYPAPIVDHGERREEAIEAFERAREED